MKNFKKHAIGVLGLIAILLLNGFSFAQQKGKQIGYTIMGELIGVPDGTSFFLVRTSKSGGPDTVQVSKSKNNNFTFKGEVSLPGESYWVIMDTNTVKIEKGKNNWITLIMENSVVKLNGRLNSWPDVSIKGSPATLDYRRYLELEKKPLEVAQQLMKSAENDQLSEIEVQKIVKDAEQRFKDFTLAYYTSALDAYNTPRLIVKNTQLDYAEKQDLYTKLSARVKNSFHGKALLDQLQREIKVKKISDLAVANGKVPDFSFTAKDGKKISILKEAAKSKYTLIDFWASWCAPCRAAVPDMKRVYEAFKDKGFNIVGISRDANEAAWKKALQQDGTTWVQGIDNIDKAGDTVFPLAAIPAYILIDKEGKIIDTDYFLDNGKQGQQIKIVKLGEKTLGNNLYEIIEGLLVGRKGK